MLMFALYSKKTFFFPSILISVHHLPFFGVFRPLTLWFQPGLLIHWWVRSRSWMEEEGSSGWLVGFSFFLSPLPFFWSFANSHPLPSTPWLPTSKEKSFHVPPLRQIKPAAASLPSACDVTGQLNNTQQKAPTALFRIHDLTGAYRERIIPFLPPAAVLDTQPQIAVSGLGSRTWITMMSQPPVMSSAFYSINN